MIKHNKLKKDAVEAIGRLFTDTSVPFNQTQNDLEDLIEDLRDKRNSLENFPVKKKEEDCFRCEGEGWIQLIQQGTVSTRTCYVCKGTGKTQTRI